MFQEKVTGMTLLYHRSVVTIHFNGKQQSSDQDIRLWSAEQEGGTLVIFIMFYTNSRRNEAKEHLQLEGIVWPH